jgi:hypothetical protein
MFTILLFSIPLSSYITLSVVVMILWMFFVMTKLQIDTSSGGSKRAARPEPTPFSFFKPGENPTPIIPPSTLSDQELAISVTIDKGKPSRTKPAVEKPEVSSTPADSSAIDSVQPTVVAPALQTTDQANPPVAPENPDLADADEPTDYALYQPRQISMVPAPPMLGIVIDVKPGETAEPTPERLKTLKDVQADADEKTQRRRQKTEQLMKLAAGLDFEAYVKLFRTYFDRAIAEQKTEPSRAFYVVFAELIAGETASVQEQLLLLLDKEPTTEEPDELTEAEVITADLVDEAEPFT